MKTLQNRIKYTGSFFVLLSAVFLSACGGSSNDNSSVTPDTVAELAVTSTAPVDQDAGVATNVKVVAVFNNEMNAGTIDDTSFTLQGESEPAIVGAVSYNPDTLTTTLEPNSNLSDSTLYTAVITQAVEDATGSSLLADFSWEFTTGTTTDTTAPTVDSSSPADAATGVLLNAKVTVTFDEAIDPDTVTASNVSLYDDTNTAAVAASLRYINPTTVVLLPNADLAASSDHTLTLTSAITDIAGNPLTLTTIGFTTGTSASSSPATVDLGTAGNYVILAKTGISTTGTTHITGDIAVSPESQTALTGFSETLSVDGTFATSSLVTGKLYAADMTSPTPTTLTTAVLDMGTAYSDAAGRSNPDFVELGAGEIGGMTLDPGLYKWGTSVLATSNVTLEGDANDVWIFQVGQDFKLQGGKAIILSQTAIILKSAAVINGRALAQTATTLIASRAGCCR